jgi:hypothetical protein
MFLAFSYIQSELVEALLKCINFLEYETPKYIYIFIPTVFENFRKSASSHIFLFSSRGFLLKKRHTFAPLSRDFCWRISNGSNTIFSELRFEVLREQKIKFHLPLRSIKEMGNCHSLLHVLYNRNIMKNIFNTKPIFSIYMICKNENFHRKAIFHFAKKRCVFNKRKKVTEVSLTCGKNKILGSKNISNHSSLASKNFT